MPARFAALRDEPVGTPLHRSAHLIVRADHDKHEHPCRFQLLHQGALSTESDDRGVDSLFDAYLDVPAPDERHQQVDGHRTVAHAVTHLADGLPQPVGGDPAEGAEAAGLRDGSRQARAGQAAAHAGLDDGHIHFQAVEDVHDSQVTPTWTIDSQALYVVLIRHDSGCVSRLARAFQLANAETWANPWPMYRALRDHDPVHHVVPADKPDHDYYVLSRHADIWAAARDHETFSSAQGLTVNYGELEMIGLQDNPPMVMQDPPVHTEFRKLVSRGFTPRQVEAVEPKVREFVVERIERLRANGGGDIVAELFKPLPSMVVAHYLGVPEEDRDSSTAGPRRSSRPTPPRAARRRAGDRSATRWAR